VVLRSRRRARHAAAAAMRRAALFLRRARAVAAIRAGFPEFCQQPAPRLDRNIVSSMLDLMPAPRLIFNEWDRHGTCTGLSPNAYSENVRKARAAVKIPDAYIAPSAPLTVTPDEVEEAFVQANPGLTRDGIAVTCRSRRLGEVRICLGKDLRFRACPD